MSLCPTRALKIVKTDHTFKENANWTGKAISEVYRQAGSGGVLLSSMGNPEPYPIYWDKILINASQVTNPSIDPLREPMETKTFLGKKPGKIERDENGNLVPNLAPQLELNVPIMFSAMSYGSISYNAHESPRPRGQRARHLLQHRRGRPASRTSTSTARTPSCRWRPAVSAYIRITWKPALPLKSRWVRAQSRASAAICPGSRSCPDISKTRMIPEGTDAISPAPHHDIYSIEDLRQLVYSLKGGDRIQKAGHGQDCGRT